MSTLMFDGPQRLRQALVSVFVLIFCAPAAASSWTLDASTWARPRTGAAMLTMDPLPEVVRAWSYRPADRIALHHPGGERGELWAAELRDWLVALGLPGSHIELVGGGEPDQLTIAVR
ncbi:MAG: hypothetical protein WD138_05945 [Halofilum sp. (in: g-proteobacteria)]